MWVQWAAVGIFLAFLLAAPQQPRAHELVQVDTVEESYLGPLRLRFDRDASAPFRAFVQTDPPRLIFDLAEADLGGLERIKGRTIAGVRAGALDQIWTRLVIELNRPMILRHVAPTDGHLTLVLAPASQAEMAKAATLAPGPEVLVPPPPPPAKASDIIRIVIDPGHGGVDPGALRQGVAEKDVTLSVALEIQKYINKLQGYEALLTRDSDQMILLDARVGFARAAQAALFVSIHANTVAVGDATGASVHVPAREASDPAAAALAVMENRSDTASGLAGASGDDDVALALHDMMRPVTHARARAAAEQIVESFRRSDISLHRKPLKSADFRVLRAPDMPSVLVELGFLSNPEERARLTDPAWQGEVAEALAEAITAWIAADAAFLSLMRE